RIFEKVGVNISTVWGEFSPKFRANIPGAQHDGKFWASGLSLVAHMRNPHVPAIHMNCRHIITSERWFGGCIDLNPAIPYDEDTEFFHARLRSLCDAYTPSAYEKYSTWCDEYFTLKHRQCKRGVGGIFYDQLDSGDFDADNAFTKAVGESILDVFQPIIARRAATAYGEEDKNRLNIYRGRYAEFNLLYDRGTKFGIHTGANTQAVLMSLPPTATWE
ncbi:MAG: oxygen-dependent coproporphyrinogen oxidase, partial [Pseudomonadota bacterium]